MPVPVEPTPVETESVQTARPVVAVLGEPGTRGGRYRDRCARSVA